MRIFKFLLLFNLTLLNAQVNDEDVNNFDYNANTATPDVSAFARMQLSELNKYVGRANTSIPIYTIESGNLKYPINLSYNTGGIKVDQIASDVGLGWSLSSTIISRTINRGNDFSSVGNNSVLNSGYSFATQVEHDYDFDVWFERTCKLGYFLNQTLQKKVSVNDPNIDFVPDQYNFYSSDFQTSFFFPNISTPVEINPKGTKIVAVKGKILFDSQLRFRDNNGNVTKCYDFPSQDFFSIVITSPSGIKYTFNDYDLSISFDKNPLFNYDNFYGGMLNPYPASISAWHISEIEDTNTGKKISFEYDTTHSNPWLNVGTFLNATDYAAVDQKIRKSYNSFKTSDYDDTACNYYTQSDVTIQALDITCTADVQKKRLKRIIFDEGSVEYKYNNDGGSVSGIGNTREDLYNGDFITKIIVKNKKAEVIKAYDFFYNYFSSDFGVNEFNPDGVFNPYRYKRLKLTHVKESGKPTYNFEYEESIKLPPINSFAVDFLGFFNGSTDLPNIATVESVKPSPKLYYYPNKLEMSVLPFPVPNQTYATVNGVFNRQSNDLSKAWSLKKITFPTGGSKEFVYESNKFQIFGEDIMGGGIRIKQQIIDDGSGGLRTVNYSYLDTNGKSSGTLSSIPFFGHPAIKFFTCNVNTQDDPPTISSGTVVYNTTNWKTFDKSNLNADLTSGAFVGYSRVIEAEAGNGKTESSFSSNNTVAYQNKIVRLYPEEGINYTSGLSGDGCLSGFIIGNSNFESGTFTDNSYKRGKLLEELIYNEAGGLLIRHVNEYLNSVYNTYSYTQPITYPLRTASTSNRGHLLNAIKTFQVSSFNQISQKVFEYFPAGTLSNETTMSYNPKGFKISETTITSDTNLQTNYYYPEDSQMSAEPFRNDLISKNVINIPLKTEYLKGGEKIAEKKIVYAKDASTSNLVLPKYVYSKKGNDTNATLEKKMTYDKYDAKGNLLQYTNENGIPVSIVWGYNKTLPVAKLENIAYASITPSLITDIETQSSDTGNDATLITKLTSLRTAYPLVMITTYTYKRLVGAITITDPKGEQKTYDYDSFNRLLDVKDNGNKILSEYEYHYKLPN